MTFRLLGDADKLKFGVVAGLTVRVTVAEWTIVPLVPVIVIVEVPAGVVLAVITVIVEVPEPDTEAGTKLAVAPAGSPLALKVTVPVNPFTAPTVTVYVALLPCTTVWEDGEAERLKPDEFPASALISPAPLGLPQPVAKSYPPVAEKPLLPLTMSWKSLE